MLIKLGQVHIKMVSKAWRWMKGDQSKWSKLTLEEHKEVETSPKEKYMLGVLFLLSRRNKEFDRAYDR